MDNLQRNHTEFIKNKTLILKSQQIFRSEKHNVFTEEVYEIVLGANDNKRIQSINLIESYAYERRKDLVY